MASIIPVDDGTPVFVGQDVLVFIQIDNPGGGAPVLDSVKLTRTLETYINNVTSRQVSPGVEQGGIEIGGQVRRSFSANTLSAALSRGAISAPFDVDVAKVSSLQGSVAMLMDALGDGAVGAIRNGLDSIGSLPDALGDAIRDAGKGARSAGEGAALGAVLIPVLWVVGIIVGAFVLVKLGPGLIGAAGSFAGASPAGRGKKKAAKALGPGVYK